MTSELLHPVSARLLRSTAKQSYDPEVDIDWDAGRVPGLYAMRPERMSLYGTKTWDRLSEEQRILLSEHEVASIASVGLWFEIVLMKLLLREVYSADPRAERTHFALTEIGDETRHSVMFGKSLGAMGMPAYGPRPLVHKLGRLFPLLTGGPGAYAAILLGEEPADRWQREVMNDESIQPLVRMVMRIHVLEEARHVTFAREEVIARASKMSRAERAWQQFLVAQVGYVTMRSLVHPQVYAAVGLDPMEARREALGNPHYQETIAWMGEKVMPFLEEHGMVGKAHHKVWRGSFLMR
jgi:hypothetical protein